MWQNLGDQSLGSIHENPPQSALLQGPVAIQECCLSFAGRSRLPHLSQATSFEETLRPQMVTPVFLS